MLPILNPVTLLYREADTTALQWIEDNLPPEATILINPFRWSREAYAGQDGGYWITPLTGRKTIPPPLFYAEGSPQEVERVNQISQKAIELAGDPAGLQEQMKQNGLRYVFIGRRGGVFSAKALAESGLFQTLFDQDGTWIFKLKP